MIVESNADRFLDSVDRDFHEALDDAADFARAQKGAPSDLEAEHLGPLHGRIGSSRDYAMAQERGAFIRPRRRATRTGRPPALKLADGRFMRWARIPAQRYLAKTGKQWGRFLVARLRT